MSPQEYIDKRIKDQQDWYGKSANANKRVFMRFQTVIIILSGSIPVIVASGAFLKNFITISHVDGLIGLIAAIISGTIAVVAGIDKLKQPQANWFNYRANEEMLKKEEWLFLYNAGPYKGITETEKHTMLVERVESIISADIARFTKMGQPEKTETEKTPTNAPRPEVLPG